MALQQLSDEDRFVIASSLEFYRVRRSGAEGAVELIVEILDSCVSAGCRRCQNIGHPLNEPCSP